MFLWLFSDRESIVDNYRQKTLNNNFFKVFGNALHEPIYKHVKKMIVVEQLGLMKPKSTKTNFNV